MQRNPWITFHLAGFALFRCGMTCFVALVDFAPNESSIRQALFLKLNASLSYKSTREETLVRKTNTRLADALLLRMRRWRTRRRFYWSRGILHFRSVYYFFVNKPCLSEDFVFYRLKIHSNSRSRLFDPFLSGSSLYGGFFFRCCCCRCFLPTSKTSKVIFCFERTSLLY